MFRGLDVRALTLGALLTCSLSADGLAQVGEPPRAPDTQVPAPQTPPVEVPPAEVPPPPPPRDGEPGNPPSGENVPADAPVDLGDPDEDSDAPTGEHAAPAEPAEPADLGDPDEGDEATDTEANAADADAHQDGTFHLGTTHLELTPDDIFRSGGSVAVVNQAQLERLGYSDPTNILQRVPGVMIRVEDGFGLRPNISIRGTNPERSRGIALMEDGVLFGPAPYSAPAAYFFPLVNRMTGVEVFKGPAAILYGPQTTGGSVNFLSREIPTTPSGEVRLSYGSFNSRVMDAHYGMSNARAGFLFEIVDIGTDGFKHIDNSTDTTGFSRTEGLLRGFVQSRTSRRVYHRLGLKLTYSRERSNETYLGLSDADFRADPDRRYIATDANQMRWHRFSYELEHRLEAPHHIALVTTLYRHDFHRDWHRFDRFGPGGPSVVDVLQNPTGVNQVYLDILRGDEDSDPSSPNTDIMAVNNDRTYVSQGVQSTLTWDHQSGRFTHQLRAGARLHYDSIVRHHTSETYVALNRQLVSLGLPLHDDTYQKASTIAGALFAAYSMEVGRFRISPGIRTELIQGTLTNYLTNTTDTAFRSVVLGGLSANFAATDSVSIFAGSHRGFGPVAPGSATSTSPELSLNFEAGARYRDDDAGVHAEFAVFVNDYSNMLLTCTETGGCPVESIDKQFNAGGALVGGLEAAYQHEVNLPGGFTMPLAATYSFMLSRFQDAFTSADTQYKDIQVGDQIPYLPRHQGTLGAGIQHERFRFNATATFVAAMREQGGSGHTGFWTDRQAFLDLSGEVRVHQRIHLTMRLENVTNSRPIVAHRPYGARPYRPLTAQLGLRVTL